MRKLLVAVLFFLSLPLSVYALSEPDVIVTKPGDSGYDARRILEVASELGYLEELPLNESVYRETYMDAIKTMERALQLTDDGVIYLSEFVELDGLLHEGSKSESVQDLIEKLHDLGYISGSLPAIHFRWDAKYTEAITKAERDLGLQADGILLQSELDAIMKTPIELGKVKNLNANVSGGKVNLSWDAVPGATWYVVVRNDAVVQKVFGSTRWQDTDVSMDQNYYYKVRASKYTVRGQYSDGKSVYIEIVYQSTSLTNILKDKAAYKDAYVDLSNMKYESYSWSGGDLHVRVSAQYNGRTQYATLILPDYRNWTGEKIYNHNVKTIRGKGQVTSVSGNIQITLTSFYMNW